MTAAAARETTARLRLQALSTARFDAFAAMCADPRVMRCIGDGLSADRAVDSLIIINRAVGTRSVNPAMRRGGLFDRSAINGQAVAASRAASDGRPPR